MSPYLDPQWYDLTAPLAAEWSSTRALVIADWLEERGEVARAEFIRDWIRYDPKRRKVNTQRFSDEVLCYGEKRAIELRRERQEASARRIPPGLGARLKAHFIQWAAPMLPWLHFGELLGSFPSSAHKWSASESRKTWVTFTGRHVRLIVYEKAYRESNPHMRVVHDIDLDWRNGFLHTVSFGAPGMGRARESACIAHLGKYFLALDGSCRFAVKSNPVHWSWEQAAYDWRLANFYVQSTEIKEFYGMIDGEEVPPSNPNAKYRVKVIHRCEFQGDAPQNEYTDGTWAEDFYNAAVRVLFEDKRKRGGD